MKAKIKIEIEIDLNDFTYLSEVLNDVNHYICNGVQMRATHFRSADYNYHVHVPVRRGGKINYTEDSIVFTHKSKIK